MRDWNDIVSKELQEEERKQLGKQLKSETKNHFPKKAGDAAPTLWIFY